MKEIHVTKNKIALVDDEDFDKVKGLKWWYGDGRPITKGSIRMHQLILEQRPGFEVDHKDGNPFNNQKSNLRYVSHQQNCLNKAIRSNNTSGFIGVHFHAGSQKFQAKITINGRVISLGLFETVEEAAKRRDRAALFFHKEYAKLNFPDLFL